MTTRRLRILLPLIILIAAGVAFALNVPLGTPSSFGWEQIALICPIGAIGTMLATKAVVPRAIISLALAVIALILLGKAFCSWACPVPLIDRFAGLFRRKNPDGMRREENESGESADSAMEQAGTDDDVRLTERDLAILRGCRACDAKEASGSRYFILGGALLSAAVFGFPVFCLICPVGLSFGLVFVIMLLFAKGATTWSVILIPALLFIEVVFFRSWCGRICPISALMSLVARANRTFRPTIDDARCLETNQGVECGRCAKVCDQGIDPRRPELGARWAECTKCRACLDACPGNAITMPFLPRSKPRITHASCDEDDTVKR